MGYLAVVVAALASFTFGAVWYMALAKRWMAAAGVAPGDINRKDMTPFLIGFLATLIVAGMMRHIFNLAGIDTPVKGLLSGLGLGLFIAAPWIVTNYAFAKRPQALMFIDGGYATFGCAIIGLVLTIL